MSTMDIIKLEGGEPANFLDVGGDASLEAITEAFRIILSEDTVTGVLVNIFGGIMQCDRIAQAIVAAAEDVGFSVPLVVRLEGTNAEPARPILEQATTVCPPCRRRRISPMPPARSRPPSASVSLERKGSVLVLWDIDGTLLSSEGTGARGIEIAGRELFGGGFLLVVGHRTRRATRPADSRRGHGGHGRRRGLRVHHDAYRARNDILEVFAGDHGRPRHADPAQWNCSTDWPVPGVTHGPGDRELRERPDSNSPRRASTRICSPSASTATRGTVRHDLPPLAIQPVPGAGRIGTPRRRAAGDTEHDITSGRAAGCRVLAVCTGSHDKQRLLDAGADLVLDDLSEVDAVLAWILARGARGSAVKPTIESNRIASIDVLRGLAMLGILVLNIQIFAMPFESYGNPLGFGDVDGSTTGSSPCRWCWRT